DQRLIMRVLAHWRSIAPDNSFPRRAQIDPQGIGHDWANCILIDLAAALQQSRYAYVGQNLRDPSWPNFDRQCVSECLEGSLLHLVNAEIPTVVTKRSPIGFGGVGHHNNVQILYRAILMPLSEDGTRIDGIIGAANYRELAQSHKIDVSAREDISV